MQFSFEIWLGCDPAWCMLWNT